MTRKTGEVVDCLIQVQVTFIAIVVVLVYLLHIVPVLHDVKLKERKIESLEQRIEQLARPHLKDQDSWQRAMDIIEEK